jgi:hypothetical protein
VSLTEFLKRQVAESSLLDSLAYYYADVVEHLEGALTRSVPCPFADQGLLLNPDGLCSTAQQPPDRKRSRKSSSELYYRQENLTYRGKVQKETCPSCGYRLFFVSLRRRFSVSLLCRQANGESTVCIGASQKPPQRKEALPSNLKVKLVRQNKRLWLRDLISMKEERIAGLTRVTFS